MSWTAVRHRRAGLSGHEIVSALRLLVDEERAHGVPGLESPLHSKPNRLSPMRGVIRRVEEQRLGVRRDLDANAVWKDCRAGRARDPLRRGDRRLAAIRRVERALGLGDAGVDLVITRR